MLVGDKLEYLEVFFELSEAVNGCLEVIYCGICQCSVLRPPQVHRHSGCGNGEEKMRGDAAISNIFTAAPVRRAMQRSII